MRRNARKDTNQDEIVEAMRAIGATVQTLHQLGGGVPDLLIGWRGVNYLWEVKDGNKPPSKRRLTPDEAEWHNGWRGQVDIIESKEQAIAFLQEAGK